MMTRFSGAMVAMLTLVGCSASPPPSPAKSTPGVGTSPRQAIAYFQGSVDVANHTVSFQLLAPPSKGLRPEAVTVGYGNATDRVYLHTVDSFYDDGTNSTTHSCNAMPGQILLCGDVEAHNGYTADMTGVTAFIDTFSETGIIYNGPYAYGTVSASSFSSSMHWVFTLPSSSGFTFTGHVVGNVPWYNTGSMSIDRLRHTATLLQNGKVLVCGGDSNSTAHVLASCEIYDPTAGSFSSTGSMNTARELHAASLLSNGNVLISGGLDSSGTKLATTELYDATAGTFSSAGAGTLVTARADHTQTTLPSGQVLVAGGYIAPGLTPTATAELYDPTMNSWASTGGLNNTRTLHTATLLSNGNVLVVGGGSAVAEVYSGGTWTTSGSLGSGSRTGHQATIVSNGVLITGGLNSNGVVGSMELYDPTSGMFAGDGALVTAREFHTATLLTSGHVLVAGGYDGTSALSSAEECDPVAGTCAATGSLNNAREQAVGIALSSGETLVVGGYTGGFISTATAELYDN